MAATTGIEWTDSTWNPIRGCTRVSEGCRNCYAEKVAYRFNGPGQAYEGLAVLRNGHAGWTGKIRFVEEHLLDPLKWKPVLTGIRDGEGELRQREHRDGTVTVTRERPRRIFVNSMSDLFHEGVTRKMLLDIAGVMVLAYWHTFQILTKRPQNLAIWADVVAEAIDIMRRIEQCGGIAHKAVFRALDMRRRDKVPWTSPLPNVWLGVSVENQAAADDRIPLLLDAPAAVRFLSCEPLLGPVDLTRIPCEHRNSSIAGAVGTYDALGGSWWPALGDADDEYRRRLEELPHVDWVICGGESGTGARPMHPDWARSLRDQCQAAGVPFFFKQWGEWADVSAAPYEGARTQQEHIFKADGEVLGVGACGQGMVDPGWRPAGAAWMRRIGKHAAGALLDGVEWKQFPIIGR